MSIAIEAAVREEKGAFGAFLLATAVLSVGFHVYLIFSGLLPELAARPLHLALAMPWLFFVGVKGPAWWRWLSVVIGVLGIAGCVWIVLNRVQLVDQYGRLESNFQIALAVFLILVTLEMARRAVGWIMPSIAAIVLLYGLFGQYIPGYFGHAGLPLEFYLGTLLITEGGLWSSLTATSAELVAPFLILGALVAAGDAGTGFMTFAKQIAGRYRAGPAKVEVLASALYGTISGSASANVASTGTFTIPAMIRSGYPPSFAAATEAVASTGGQIMPPVMGAGIFIMASLIQIPYSELMVIALPGAILFFIASWIGIDHFAVRLGLTRLAPMELPGWTLVGRTLPFFLTPLLILIGMIIFTGYTPQFCAMVAIIVSALLLAIDLDWKFSLPKWSERLTNAVIAAATQIASIAAIIVCAGLITGVFHMTGLGVKFTSLIVNASGGYLPLALLLTAIACLVLGMELPTTAAYVICVAVAGPALIEVGLSPLQAHMFVFWYALMCTITPPVCGNVFIAAGIAKTPWLPVAFRAMRIGLGLFAIPIGFIANPSLLGLLNDPWLALLATVKVGVGLWFLSYGLIAQAPAWKLIGSITIGAAIILLYGF